MKCVCSLQATGLSRDESYEINFDKDRPGNDLPDMPLYMGPDAGFLDCGLLCEFNEQCFAFTFSYCRERVGRCWLKSRVSTAVDYECLVRMFVCVH